MAKAILFAILALFSTAAFGKSECYLLLTNPADSQVTAQGMAMETHWMETLSAELGGSNPKWSIANITQRWNSWQKLTSAQRDQALRLELMKISPPEAAAQPVIFLNGKQSLAKLSAENKTRMLKQLEAAYPLSKEIKSNRKLNQTANNLAATLDFSYGRPVNPLQFNASPENYSAPIASPRELAALDLGSAVDGFYSNLIGVSPSVEFVTLATKSNATAAAEVGTLLRRETFVLKDKFASENGFVLPSFADTKQLLDFFEFWDPSANEELVRANWNSLPKTLRGYAEFRAYLEMYEEDFITPQRAYVQLAPLRTRLNQYVMTTADSKDFLKQAFLRYFLSLAGEDSKAAAQLASEVGANSGQTIQLFRKYVFPLLHMPAGMSLRIPVAVSAANYNLSRVNDSHFSYERSMPRSHGPFFDPRPMDHSSKP